MMNDVTNESHLSSSLRDTTEGTQRDSRQAFSGICFSLQEGVCSALIISEWRACD